MADSDLKDRLRESAKAFDGLLSLIPATMYYGEDTSDQWQRKKQSKAEKKAAMLGKLDPDSERNRSVKDVMEEKARSKRKLEEMASDAALDQQNDDDNDSLPMEGIKMEQPLKRRKKTGESQEGENNEEKAGNKPVGEASQAEEPDDPSHILAKKQQKLAKQQKKLEKKAKKEAKLEAKLSARGIARKPNGSAADDAEEPTTKRVEASEPQKSTDADDEDAPANDELEPMALGDLVTKNDDDVPSPTASHTSQEDLPVFDAASPCNKDSIEPASAATSISSAVPPSERPKHAKLPASSSDAFRARLAARIEELRKARKAGGEDGRPAMSRQELIESRREKQAQRKAHKKEVRRLAKEEADRKREEALASARTSPGSFMSPLRGADGDDADGQGVAANHFAFGRIAFADGAQMSHDLSYVKEKGAKKKGPSDPKTALAKLEAQKKRFEGLDEDKRKEVLEKETWLAARRRAEGEKIRDDEALLKKAVKRKEQAKKKSEKEWGERKAGVEKAIKDRQKKREDNLRKRRDEKLLGKMGKKKGGAKAKGGSGGAKKNRAGFEGTGLGGGKRR